MLPWLIEPTDRPQHVFSVHFPGLLNDIHFLLPDRVVGGDVFQLFASFIRFRGGSEGRL